jgi:hypothetical protein
VDLDSPPGTGVVLIETQNKIGIYACLSHRWGGQCPLETTQRTLTDHKSNIPWTRLPITFQDAIAVARRLSIRYLWFDSLCIIQDDYDDWKVESALMADIYSNALIALAASGSNGPNEGLYFSRDQAYAHHALSAFEDTYVRRGLQHLPSDLPLLTRGWVFQERLLSPRFLHFGRQELIWECMETRTCECHCIPTPIVGWFETKDSYHPKILQGLPLDQLGKTWRKVVRDYTQMKLSVSSDIFPAISGAVRIMAQALKRQNSRPKYLAGMWECWFIEHLLWYTRMPSKACRPSVWRAPTFSWASISSDAGIEWSQTDYFLETVDGSDTIQDDTIHDDTSTKVYAELLDSHCIPEGLDEMGKVTSGYVVLSGSLWKGAVEDMGTIDIYIQGERVQGFRHREFFPDVMLSSDDVPGDVYCLQLLSLHSIHWDLQQVFYLVLRKSNGVNGDAYERLGLLRYMSRVNSSIEEWFDQTIVRKGAVLKIV